ncbi:MAG: hypothetical protein JJV98_11250 [Desulfosarcina sp.]|nr:hypothetical protein [Desulfobacterales bacterium]
MPVIPREKPTLGNMNSYYVQIPRLIEHFQGEVGCGVLHFKSSSSEGLLFFDKDEILNGFFAGRNGESTGRDVIAQLIQSTESINYILSVYQIKTEDIYFWSNIPNAKRIYQDLSTEFTDLEGLVKKMCTEALTGFIEVSISQSKEGGLVLFNNGQICGGSYSWGAGDTLRDDQDLTQLIQLTKERGGLFHVSRMQPSKPVEEAIEEELEVEELSYKPSIRILTAIEELMVIFERTALTMKNLDSNFATLLNRKFVEKADQYPFLDPFAAEFKYAHKKISFVGDTTDEELIKGVLESINEIAEEIDATAQFRSNLATWAKKYKSEVEKLKIKI